jgi:hypothetical protein
VPKHDEYEMVTIRLRKGDRDRMATYFHPIGYNQVIRTLVSKVVDNVAARADTAQAVEDIEVNLEELGE